MSVDLPVADLTEQDVLDCRVFTRMQVQTNPLGGNVIGWELDRDFRDQGPFHFYVDFGHAGTNEWTPLNTVPIVDHCMFIDPCQRHWDNQVDYYYRVRLVMPNQQNPDGSCVNYVSQPQQANGVWTRDDWLLAREIIRKELLLRNKRTNKSSPGYIMKPRRHGTKYAPVHEFDTGELQHTNSDLTWGTSYLGGYHAAIDFTLIFDTPWDRETTRHPQVGAMREIVRTARAIPYPYIQTYDIYIRRDNGERYYIHKIKTLAEAGGVPLIQSLELRLAPVTDIIYSVPLTGGDVSSSSSSSDSSSQSGGDDCDWRTGLNTDTSW